MTRPFWPAKPEHCGGYMGQNQDAKIANKPDKINTVNIHAVTYYKVDRSRVT